VPRLKKLMDGKNFSHPLLVNGTLHTEPTCQVIGGKKVGRTIKLAI
jgi:hypothetical protein